MRNVPVAQLDRVSDSDSDGCRFDPCRVRQNIIEALKDRLFYFVRKNMYPFVPVAQLDRVSDSDSDGCRFDPCRVRQNIIEALKDRLFYFVRKNMYPFVKGTC